MENSRLGAKFLCAIMVIGLLSGCASTRSGSKHSTNSGANTIASGALAIGQSQDQKLDQMQVASGKEIIKAFDGGILPAADFKKLSRKDRTRALLAEYRALEASATGQPVTWQNPNGKSSGTVTAAAPYQVGAQNCRQYTHIAKISGRPVQNSGAACRSLDGKWVPLR